MLYPGAVSGGGGGGGGKSGPAQGGEGGLFGPMVGSGSGDGEMAPVGITHGADWTGAGTPSPGAKYPGSLTGPVSFKFQRIELNFYLFIFYIKWEHNTAK